MFQNCISIITVSYNAVNVIEKTILSTINQTYQNIEYIIIDGGSNDGTIDIIKKYSNKISYWISEPDKGIYDAMNKGIDIATGDWIIFMNAGDWFYNKDIINNIFYQKKYNSDIIYGAVERRGKFKTYIDKPRPLKQIINNMIFSHQSTFVKTHIMKKYKFEGAEYNIIADYAFFIKQYKNGTKFEELNYIISSYDNISGISSSPTYKVYKKHLKERIKLEKQYNLNKYKNLYFFYCIRYQIKNFLFKLFGFAK